MGPRMVFLYNLFLDSSTAGCYMNFVGDSVSPCAMVVSQSVAAVLVVQAVVIHWTDNTDRST